MTITETGRDDDSHRDIAFTGPVKPAPEHPSRGFLLLIAAVAAAAGIEIGYDAFVHSPRLRDPPTIGYLVALIFLSGAARLLEMASGRHRKGTWVAFIFFGAFGVIAWWIALASPRNCSSSLNGLSIIGGEAVCKFGFGVFAAFSTLMFCALLSRAVRRKRSYY